MTKWWLVWWNQSPTQINPTTHAAGSTFHETSTPSRVALIKQGGHTATTHGRGFICHGIRVPNRYHPRNELKPVPHTTLHTASRTNLWDVSAVQGHRAIASTIHVACRTARGWNGNNVKVRPTGEKSTVALILNLVTALWVGVVSFTHRLQYPAVHFLSDWVGSRGCLNVSKRKILWTYRKSNLNSSINHPVASQCAFHANSFITHVVYAEQHYALPVHASLQGRYMEYQCR